MPRPPFAGEPHATVVLPERDPTLGGERELLELEIAELEAELRAPARLVEVDPGVGARWVLVVDESHEGPSRIEVDSEGQLITSSAADVGGLFESMNLLRTAVRHGRPEQAVDCAHVDDAIARVVEEVADTYPSFALRDLDWGAICERHEDRVRKSGGSLASFQAWLAELQDGHTWVWPPMGNLPYAVHVDEVATFARVREGTDGHERGVRAGWTLVAIDDVVVDAAGWLARAAAPPHAHALIAGRRLLAGPVGVERELTAVSPNGDRITWSEAPASFPSPLVEWRRLDDGAGYLRVAVWVPGQGIDDAIDEAFHELRDCDRLLLDLRGNGGGNLVLARRTQTRFLRERTELGSIRYSVGGGELSRSFPLEAEPAADTKRWPGRVVVLTDSLTFSASEDFLLGLQGLEHVTVVGRRSGGGSGRPRALRLLPGMTLTVSTALTYDREGHCVEGAGIPVDVPATGSDDEVLALATRL
jgi:carboxyl-terminal processing protease